MAKKKATATDKRKRGHSLTWPLGCMTPQVQIGVLILKPREVAFLKKTGGLQFDLSLKSFKVRDGQSFEALPVEVDIVCSPGSHSVRLMLWRKK